MSGPPGETKKKEAREAEKGSRRRRRRRRRSAGATTTTTTATATATNQDTLLALGVAQKSHWRQVRLPSMGAYLGQN